MLRCEDYKVEEREIHGIKVSITTYRLDDKWHCTIANTDPGANIARSDGPSRVEAVDNALAKALKRVAVG